MNTDQFTSPTLILDTKKCLNNIKSMANKAKRHGLIFRPHFKTHQSRLIGSWFRKFGVNKITVSSVRMAEYFANDDWNDITIAFPVNIREIEAINSLADKIQLNLCIENVESIDFLIKKLKFEVGFFIKIDTGYNRTGIANDKYEVIDKILAIEKSSGKIKFKGFLSHAGHTYQAKNPGKILDIHEDSLNKLSVLKNHYHKEYPDLLVSIGDTPSCSISEEFGNINEIRPGNFVFYDLMQFNLESCKFDQIAIAATCPVVAKHNKRNEIIIHGGAIHFSKESININNKAVYGMLVKLNKNGWENYPEAFYLTKLSQEHGTLEVNYELLEELKIGDLVGIVPVHSCLTSNLMQEYFSTNDEFIDHLSGIKI